jgi:hypothetical protein
MPVKMKMWFAACVFAFMFAVACNGQGSDAIRSAASNLPSQPGISFSPSVSIPTTEAPVPSEEPTEAPTEAPTEEPTEAPTEVPTEAPTEIPTEAPTDEPVPTEGPAPSGPTATSPASDDSSDSSTAIWWVLGILAVVAVVVIMVMRSRRGPSTTLQQAYAASAAVRDRLSQEVSSPSAASPGAMEALVDEADRSLRAVEVSAPDEATRSAVAQTLQAVGDVREGLALRSATSGAAHASGADVEAQLLRSLAALTASLGPLREVAGGAPATTTGFDA